MGGKPAARLTDLTAHAPVVVITGSPDTTICFLKAARLNDVTAPCPICAQPPTPPGKIVTSSSSVFINNLGAARIGDKVACGAGGGAPGGGSHPPANGYEVRADDSYEKMMAGEHEESEFDVVDPHKGKDLDGKRDESATPVGIQPSSGRAGARSGGPAGRQPNGGKAYTSSESSSPWGRQVNRGERKNAAQMQGGDQRGAAEKQLTGRSSVGVGNSSAGAKFGEGPDPSAKKGVKVEYDKQEKRAKVTINLDFSLELSIGKRSGQAGFGGAANAIVVGAPTVMIG